jgi:hypothetical protein
MSALEYAVKLPFRAGVSKTIVLISCGECTDASKYADSLSYLIESDVTLHILSTKDVLLQGNRPEDETRLFGFDATSAYTVHQLRTMKGDQALHRQLVIPKDYCTPLALETNGTVFNAQKLLSERSKKFLNVFSRRIAFGAEPSPCQKCDCIPDRDGVGVVRCKKCVSPNIERFNQNWKELTSYDKEDSADSSRDDSIEVESLPK